MELISEQTQADFYRKTYLVSVKETEDYIVKKFLVVGGYISTGEEFKHNSTEKQQKFLCVNGTRKGEKLTLVDAEKVGYLLYNRANHPARSKNNSLKCVLVALD